MRTGDGYIIYECLNERAEAFGILVDKYKAGIYAYVYAELGNFQDAQDVTQEVFLQAYRGLRNLRRWESFSSWLYRIARNLSKKWVQRESKRPDREFIEDQNPQALENNAISSYRKSQVEESLQEALHLLPETYREALTLYYFGGMNSVDIAKALGTSPTAVRHRLSRARARLKEEMITMMDTAFEGQRLQASFTFRIVEAVKRIKINPMPRTGALPWGLSLAAGIIFTVMSLSSHLNTLNPIAVSAGLPLPSQTKALKIGEIPVDILDTSQISAMASKGADLGQAPERPVPMRALAPPDEEGKWEKKADMPTARSGHSASVVDGKIYAVGGEDRQVTSSTEVYDPATGKWSKKADMPSTRTRHSASVVDGKIYVIGGTRWEAPIVLTLEVYDPATDTWSKKADMPTPRMDFSSSVVDGKIYVFGGWTPNRKVATVEIYDPATDKWSKGADMITPRAGISSSVVDGKIYVMSGYVVWGKVVPTVEIYDPATGEWSEGADMPTARVFFCASVVDGKIYAVGNTWGGLATNVEIYDPATDTWSKGVDMPTARGGLASGVVNGRIYVIGGYDAADDALSTVEEYDTGFVLEGRPVEPNGKLPTTWGTVKRQ